MGDGRGLKDGELVKTSGRLTSRTLINLEMEVQGKPRQWILPKEWAEMGKTWNSVGTSHCICEHFIGNYKMMVLDIIPDGGLQIHMIILGGFRINESTATEGEEATHGEHFRDKVGIVKQGLIFLWVKKWKTIMGIITTGIGAILIIQWIAF